VAAFEIENSSGDGQMFVPPRGARRDWGWAHEARARFGTRGLR